MIWLVGGTHETREVLEKLNSYGDVIVTVATEEGRQYLPEDVRVRVGRMTKEEMVDFVKGRGIGLIVDLTHPFATIVSKTLREVGEEVQCPVLRYVRPREELEGDILLVDGYDECVELLKQKKGTFLFTTGSKRAEDFWKVRGDNRFIFRVIPMVRSLESLRDLGVPMADTIAMVGPFTVEMNRALLRFFKADYLVTKDSGEHSGTEEKIEACAKEGVKVIMIRREEEKGISSQEELIRRIEEWREQWSK